ncbi:MAG: hypothetical protein GAK30_01688 [Paracidovorax wautersii]|uniref:2-dehydropantoate 2-reductase n=1 Tax=Paracidovorax wautersii TaxID=1177982 RepID=A0A7V8JQQ8_9BURK|nr:MAG: hypothetical protein GAK30_01688 [Paracidovorax wautersii]
MTNICIYGAGAIGGHVAARLAHARQAQVSVVARGAHLQAIQQRGLLLTSGDERWQGPIAHATDDPSTLPPQDFVLVALKANALPSQAAAIARLLGDTGVAVFINNGIPWWWNHGLANQGGALPLLDPAGDLWRQVTPERTLGCVVYSPNEIEAPGHVRHHPGRNRFLFGEPTGHASARLARLAGLLTASGLPVETTNDLRRDVWLKLLVNAAGNPVSALTRLGTAERAADAGLVALSLALAQEIAAIAQASGWPLPADTVRTAANPPSLGVNQRPSMLQDALLGRPIETEAILGQPQAFARQLGIQTPALDVVLPLLRGLGRSLAG